MVKKKNRARIFYLVLFIVIGVFIASFLGQQTITGTDGFILIGDSDQIITDESCNVNKNVVCPGGRNCYIGDFTVTCENDNIKSIFNINPGGDESQIQTYLGTDDPNIADSTILEKSNLKLRGNDRSPEVFLQHNYFSFFKLLVLFR